MSDEVLAEVVELLYGGGASNELIAKMNPTQSDLKAKDQRNRKITAGLSAVGAAAGGAGLLYGGHKIRGAYKGARATQKAFGMEGLKGAKKGALRHAVTQEKLGTALVPLEVAGLTGEVAATKILHGDTKKKKVSKGVLVAKSMGNTEILNNASDIPTKRSITRAVITNPKNQQRVIATTKKGVGKLQKLPEKVVTTNEVEKRDVDVVWDGEIAKANEDKQQIFGWASVVEVGGEPVLDLQGDLISPDEMEKAAYEYVVKSRKGGDMHKRDNWDPIQKSDMIESFIVTDEKRQAMGLPEDIPTGWWVGFQVRDPELWEDVKTGKRTGFSIHGRGKRTPV